MNPSIDPIAIKRDSERLILSAGGKICDWLPPLDCEARATLRSSEDFIARALAMNGLIYLAFNVPSTVVAEWIQRNGAHDALSSAEQSILARPRDELSEQEVINLRWYVESLWALMWAGSLIGELPFDQGVPDTMASLCPNLRANEDGSKFARLRLRSPDELFSKLDLYFRLHWYARDGALCGYATDPVELSVIQERRRALEWLLDRDSDWDSIDLST